MAIVTKKRSRSLKLTATPITAEYVPTTHYGGGMYGTSRPYFSPYAITAMMPDPRIVFGLWLIKGPIISKSKFFVDCANKEVKEYIVKNLTRFWRGGASRTLKSIEWGYSCSEVLYKKEQGLIYYSGLKDLQPLDCKLLTLNGMPYGARIKNVPDGKGRKKEAILYGPKKLWNVHSREFHPYYGRSRLYGAFFPWNEYWSDGGASDSRRLFFYKYSFAGPTIYHPPGTTRGPQGEIIINKNLAREIGEKSRNGAVVCIPNETNPETGARTWEVQPAAVTQAPPGLLEYVQSLRDEMWEGMGIPPEVARAEGTGAFAGRKIPMDAFFSTLQDVIYWLIQDFTNQIMDHLVQSQFGNVEYEVVPFPITDGDMNQPESPDLGNGLAVEQGVQASLSVEERHYPTVDNSASLISSIPPFGYKPKYVVAI